VRNLKRVGILLLATVVMNVVINAHYRNIQETIHDGIAWVWKKNKPIGEAIYDVNAFLFNGDAFDHERKIKDYIYSAFPSVVMMSVYPNKENEMNQAAGRLSGRGTGFFIEVTDEHALVMTNYHVVDAYVENPETMQITVNTAIDMWTYDVEEVIGYDIVADLAIVKILKKDNETWEALEFADYNNISEGDPVVVIGHGMSLPWNSTHGIVTYDGRFGQRPYSLMLQVDAIINQGNSGGPVIGEDVKVYGVAQSILSPGRAIPGWDGVGLAVGARQAVRSMDYILSNEYADKGYVPYVDMLFMTKNFKYEEIKETKRDDRYMSYVSHEVPELKAPEMIADVTRKLSAGEAAGIENGDIIMEINGKKIRSSFSIFIAAMYALPGDEAVVKVKRGETELEFTLIYQETDWKKLQQSVESSQNRGR
jgi:serine protease Do